ncbi:probable aspartic proteinase GIP2 [Lycium ferocissimum]|uniref:probable aspartic proteinase GIP2 n=1 Tax=Lycium ferocissimum TaxID=112874 RepID=UPI002815CE11|nr:probable aspartic proteinase GIP2 [Lycium ferocissimum]
MPSLLHFFPFFFLVSFCVSHGPFLPKAIILPVNKDPSTFQYVTQVYMSTHLSPIKLVVDLGGSFLWTDCVSSSQKIVPCSSLKCSMAKPNGCTNNKICGVQPENPYTKVVSLGELAEDMFAVEFIDELKTGSIASIHQFLFSCASTNMLQGLARGAKGMLGLGNSRIALPSQLSDTFGFQRKFAICLSSSYGAIISGESPYLSLLGHDVSRSMLYTPLISSNGVSEEYYINVKAIKISGKKLSLNTSLFAMDEEGYGGTKISTISPFTTMKSSIYQTFVEAYEKFAISMELTKVEPMAPFGLCFSTKGVDVTKVGPNVPTIDLVLQSEMVKWRIYGRNSMVKISDEVMCLGFLDGGVSQKASIVIGGYQLEDNLLEFNLGTSMLGFTSSLSMAETSCSDFMFSKDSAFDS